MMSVLRELDPSAVHVPRWRATTFGEAIDSIRESWVATYENNDVSIQDILSGRIWIELCRAGKLGEVEASVLSH